MNTEETKQQICDIGARLCQRGFAAATDGNISCRISPDSGSKQVLCTPTRHSKGQLQPSDLCLVDLQGNLLEGGNQPSRKQPSSEIRLHLEIYRARPEIQSVVHCHPPHATAFAVAREAIPQAVLPEYEFFLGPVPITRYETPGTQAFAETVLPFVHKTKTILLASHGTVSYSETLEEAFWLTETLDAYCRILLLARSLGHVERLPEDKVRELLALKQQASLADPRNQPEFQNADPRSHAVFRDSWPEAHVGQRAFRPESWDE